MAMIAGDRSAYASGINVTPMIDVLLVLLIVFMVIVPVASKGLNTLVPQPPTAEVTPERTVVVQAFYHSGAPVTYKINGIDVAKSDLRSKLTDIYASCAERVLFVRADDKVDFAAVAELIAIGRAANVDHIGLMTPEVQLSR